MRSLSKVSAELSGFRLIVSRTRPPDPTEIRNPQILALE